jgi:hypothetical protein
MFVFVALLLVLALIVPAWVPAHADGWHGQVAFCRAVLLPGTCALAQVIKTDAGVSMVCVVEKKGWAK